MSVAPLGDIAEYNVSRWGGGGGGTDKDRQRQTKTRSGPSRREGLSSAITVYLCSQVTLHCGHRNLGDIAECSVT